MISTNNGNPIKNENMVKWYSYLRMSQRKKKTKSIKLKLKSHPKNIIQLAQWWQCDWVKRESLRSSARDNGGLNEWNQAVGIKSSSCNEFLPTPAPDSATPEIALQVLGFQTTSTISAAPNKHRCGCIVACMNMREIFLLFSFCWNSLVGCWWVGLQSY